MPTTKVGRSSAIELAILFIVSPLFQKQCRVLSAEH
jgi:hypothetical protein